MKNTLRFITLFLLITGLTLQTASAAKEQENVDSPVAISEISQEDIDNPASIETQKPGNDRATEIGLQLWMTTGRGEWEIEFGALFFKGRSLLEWDDIDAPVLVLHAEVPVSDKLSIGGLVGGGDISDGTNTDGDWIGDFQFSESKAETSGDVVLGDINLYYNVWDDKLGKDDFVVDVFLGYHYYKDSLNDKKGVQTIEDEKRVNKPFPGLDSKYRFEWEMVRIGARAELVVDKDVTIGGSLAYLYLLGYDGEAFWNLREDYRRQDPNFIHDASEGHGVEGKITIKVRLADGVYVDGGYWFVVMNAENGTDRIFFADGTQDTTDLTNVETVRHGAYGGILFEF